MTTTAEERRNNRARYRQQKLNRSHDEYLADVKWWAERLVVVFFGVLMVAAYFYNAAHGHPMNTP